MEGEVAKAESQAPGGSMAWVEEGSPTAGLLLRNLEFKLPYHGCIVNGMVSEGWYKLSRTLGYQTIDIQ